MRDSDRLDALEIIHETQTETNSVTLTVGGVDSNGQVENDSLYIHDCPPRTITELQDAGFMVSMQGDDGLKLVHRRS